ncbi:MAG: hypothetical protein JSS22_16495 [Proteobacteria bacterium]|nr:hypothetical protein [Pseudomonadota bacterium]
MGNADVGDNSGVDKGLLALIQGVLGTRHSAPPPEFELPKHEPPAPAAPIDRPPETKISGAGAVAAQEPDRPASEGYDRRKTATELAAIILKALKTLDGAPAKGFAVTVYGRNPWNAMLTITPAAGPLANAAVWHARVREMAVRLRQDYDIAED